MTSTLCGLAAAGCWASTNVIATRVVRGADPRSIPFWYSLLGLALSLPAGIALLGSAHVTFADLLWLALAGAGIALAGCLLTAAFRRGQLGVVGPLMSLEGVVAATVAFAVSGTVSHTVLAGILAAAIGALTVAAGATRRGHLAGSSYALPAAACAGVALWAFAHQPLTPLLSLAILRLFSTAALTPTISSTRMPAGMRWLLVAVTLDLLADVLFLVGARAGSLPATAVLAAQFGTLTALGGVWRWKESLTALQIAGLLILGAGVTLVAAG